MPCEEGRKLLVTRFVRHGLSRRRKVLLLHATDDVDAFALRLADGDDDIATALASGQLGYRGASFTGDMSWRLTDPPGCEQLGGYEQCLAEILGALRGTNGHPVTMSSPSDAVRRLIALVGWDSDPAVELRFGYAV